MILKKISFYLMIIILLLSSCGYKTNPIYKETKESR
jgi:hypothetical protein